ncbi:ABC-2 family transporter protein [Candidatus Daviesbacteria bacterium]|nr:ABC-2 family transporter protein [Candidatus Daviesbacteria bacterium]
MKKHLKVLIALISLSSKRYLENRINTFGTLIGSIISLIITLVFVNTIFLYTKELNHWNKYQMLFLLGISRIILSIFYGLFHRGISFITRYIRAGDLDYLLTKPVNSQFFISFRLTRPFEFINVLAGLILVGYALGGLTIGHLFINIPIFLINLICGFVILYSIYYMLATLSIWIINFYSLGSIFFIMTTPLSFPTNIYGKTVSFILTFILPIGLIISVPVEVFLRNNFELIFAEIVVASILFLCSVSFWKFALNHYTSASS